MHSAVADRPASSQSHTSATITSPQCVLPLPLEFKDKDENLPCSSRQALPTNASSSTSGAPPAAPSGAEPPGPSPKPSPSSLTPIHQPKQEPDDEEKVVEVKIEPSADPWPGPSTSRDVFESQPSTSSAFLDRPSDSGGAVSAAVVASAPVHQAQNPAFAKQITRARLARSRCRLSLKAAQRLKRLATLHPDTLKKLGVHTLKIDGLTISVPERVAAREAEIATQRRPELPIVHVPPFERSTNPLPGDPRVMPPPNPADVVMPPNARPIPPHLQSSMPSNSPLLHNLLSQTQPQQPPMPPAPHHPGTPVHHHGVPPNFFPPGGPPMTPGGHPMHPQHMDPQQHFAMQHAFERHRLMQQQQQAQMQQQQVQHQQQMQRIEQRPTPQPDGSGQSVAGSSGSVTPAPPGTPGVPPSTPGGHPYYQASTPGAASHSATPQPRPPSFGPGTPGPGAPPQMFSPPHHPHMQPGQMQMHPQMQHPQMQQMHSLHMQQMMQQRQFMMQYGRQPPPQAMPQMPPQEEPAPPPKKKRKPTKKQLKEAEAAAQQAAAAAQQAAQSGMPPQFFQDGRAVHPAAVDTRPVGPPPSMMMPGYPPGAPPGYPGGQLPPGHPGAPPHPGFGPYGPHGGPTQQQIWQMQQQQHQRMMFQQQPGPPNWHPQHPRPPPVPYPQGSNPDAQNAMFGQQQQVMQQQVQQQQQRNITPVGTPTSIYRRDSGGGMPGSQFGQTGPSPSAMQPQPPQQQLQQPQSQPTEDLKPDIPGLFNPGTSSALDDFDRLFPLGDNLDFADLADIEPLVTSLNAHELDEALGAPCGSMQAVLDGTPPPMSVQNPGGIKTESNGGSLDSTIDRVARGAPPVVSSMQQQQQQMPPPQQPQHLQPQMTHGMPPSRQMSYPPPHHPMHSHANSTLAQHLAAGPRSMTVGPMYENGQRPLMNGHTEPSTPTTSSAPMFSNGPRRVSTANSEHDAHTDAQVAEIVSKVKQATQQKESGRNNETTKPPKAPRKSRKKTAPPPASEPQSFLQRPMPLQPQPPGAS